MSILETAAYGFAGFSNLAKKAVPKLLTFQEVVKLNRDVFLPVVEAGVTEISVNILGEERAQVEEEIREINEQIFDPFFGYVDSVNKSLI